MKHKSPQNYRRKKRTNTEKYRNTLSFDELIINVADSTTLYFNGSGFSMGDVITISNDVNVKQSKKVHPARRRIPKRINGVYTITNVDSNNTITISNDGI